MNFFMKKLMEHQLKNVPADQREMIMKMVDKDPELFKKISKEVKEKQKNGVDQFTASTSVMMKYKKEIQKLMQE